MRSQFTGFWVIIMFFFLNWLQYDPESPIQYSSYGPSQQRYENISDRNVPKKSYIQLGLHGTSKKKCSMKRKPSRLSKVCSPFARFYKHLKSFGSPFPSIPLLGYHTWAEWIISRAAAIFWVLQNLLILNSNFYWASHREPISQLSSTFLFYFFLCFVSTTAGKRRGNTQIYVTHAYVYTYLHINDGGISLVFKLLMRQHCCSFFFSWLPTEKCWQQKEKLSSECESRSLALKQFIFTPLCINSEQR